MSELQCIKCLSPAFVCPEKNIALCKKCFSIWIEKKVKKTLQKHNMVKCGDHVAIGLSGGKDSVVLLHILNKITKTLDIKLTAIIIDEGVENYRGEGIKIAIKHADTLQIPYKLYSYEELFKTTLDKVVELQPLGKSSCAVCGTFRRKALNIAALSINANVLATGHNLDDEAQTILLNLLRGDFDRLVRTSYEPLKIHKKFIPRIKPLLQISQINVVYYALANNLEYHDVECPYANMAMRNSVKKFLFSQEKNYNGTLINMIKLQEKLSTTLRLNNSNEKKFIECLNCGDVTDDQVTFLCAACRFREELSKLEFLPME